MALAIGRKADHVRVLSDLSGLVVGALIDDVESGPESDAFTDALRRYREEGAPDLAMSWRAATPAPRVTWREAEVLRHLTRDLLKGVSMPETSTGDASEPEERDSPPANVRPIESATLDVPALELASDGTWKPSGSALQSQEDVDASALRRSVPSIRSRYPQVTRADHVVLPPAPKRFTEVTAPPLMPIEIPQKEDAAEPAEARIDAAEAPEVEGSQVSNEAATLLADAVGRRGRDLRPEATSGAEAASSSPPAPPPHIERESIIKAVAGGTEVVAGPFARFQQLAVFVKALRALPGVQDVATRQFVRGMVHLRVRHAHGTALADRLLELTDFAPSIVSSTQDRIELRVDIAE
jgi:hypothetical protein